MSNRITAFQKTQTFKYYMRRHQRRTWSGLAAEDGARLADHPLCINILNTLRTKIFYY